MTISEQSVIESINKIGISYEAIQIDPEFADTAAFCEKYGYPVEQSCNTIIITSKRGPKKNAACVVLANTRLDVNNRVKNILGVSKASFASSEEMMEITGMQMGGVTPFSLPRDLPIYVDERIMRLEWIILGGGGRSLKIKISPRVFTELGAEIISGLALEQKTG
jgi:prolyl-tRNA editing enzyme YbaK/EbsC (Cys-tRNA(Pro) deacylase)